MEEAREEETTNRKKSIQMFFCDICQMQFNGLGSLQQHKTQEKHVQGSNAKTTDANPGIYVRGYAQGTKENDLVKYFSQFGNIIWAHFGYDFVLFDFTDPKSVDKVMGKNGHFLQGRRLVVCHKQMQNRVATNDDEINEKLFETITDDLKTATNFEQECQTLLRHLKNDPAATMAKSNAICHDLHATLCKRFPRIRIHLFGSTVTGLNFKNSDIDVHLANVKEDDNDKNWLHIIRKLLIKSNKFANCFVIAFAKTPLIKCVHLSTKLHLDINVKDMLGVCNTQLINYYLTIHMRVMHTMIILKYWCKVHDITGQNHRFTNYTLALMFVFFLQQQYKMPSVEALQANATINEQGHWNGAFLPDYHFRSHSLMRMTTLELLMQFFDFYLRFPFKTAIICPYLGRLVARSHFDEPHLFGFDRYKKWVIDGNAGIKADGVVCLQDPLEHSRNITGAITEPVLEHFLIMCKKARDFCQSQQGVLYRMLTETPVKVKDNYVIREDFVQLSLRKPIQDKSADPDLIKNFLMIVFKQFLLMDVTPDDAKHSKTDTQSDVYEAQAYKCSAKYSMWQSRKVTANQLKVTESGLMERELAVTEHLRQLYEGFKNDTAILSCKLTVEDKDEETVVGVKKEAAYKKSFMSFAMFLGAHLPVWFDAFVKETNK